MSYVELIHRLLTVSLNSGIKMGLQNVQRLQEILHFPDRSFTSIHVAGTNGKGSVCIKTARAFEETGYKTALYTSPHVSCFRERIRINGEMILEDQMEKLLLLLFQTVEQHKIPATFFELTTFLAFLYFAQEKVDVAIIETGLGGRLDATNIIHPVLSIITSISFDHTEFLGSTLELIAKEKGGIIKEKVPVIIGPHVPLDVIQTIAAEKKSPCLQVQCSSSLYEEENRAVAQAALNQLAPRFNLSNESIEKGLDARQPCRFEIFKGHPLTILDVGHNPDGILHLFAAIAHHFPKQPLRLLFGLSKNKDITSCLKIIGTKAKHFHLVESTNGRGASPHELKNELQNHTTNSAAIFTHDSIEEGVHRAKEEALKHHEILVIFGTFFIMADARQALGFQDPRDPFDLNEKSPKKD